MTARENRSRQRAARASFKRLMLYVLAAAVVMEIVLLVYLSMTDSLTRTAVIAASIGVMVSVILGAGLMALAFLSSNSGIDEAAGRQVDESRNTD